MRATALDRRIFLPPLSAWTLTGGAVWDPVEGIWLPSRTARATSPLVPVPPWASRAHWDPGIVVTSGTHYARLTAYAGNRASTVGLTGWATVTNWALPSGSVWLEMLVYPHASGYESWTLPHGGTLTFT